MSVESWCSCTNVVKCERHEVSATVDRLFLIVEMFGAFSRGMPLLCWHLFVAVIYRAQPPKKPAW